MGSFQNLHTSKYGDKALSDTVFSILFATDPLTKVFGMEVDNTGNTDDVFVKMWSAASPTVGTTVPDLGIFRVEAGKKQPIFFNGLTGMDLVPDFYVACVTTGGTGGSTAPTNAVTADIFTD